MRQGHTHYRSYTPYSGTILVGEHFCNWLKPPLRATTPTRTLYWLALKERSRALAAQLWDCKGTQSY